LRYEILYREGGVYADHDAKCLKSFDGFHRGYEFYCGLEAPHPIVGERYITAGIGVLGSRAKHPIAKQIIELIGRDWETLALKYPGSDAYSRTQLVMERTYMKCTEAIEAGMGKKDIVLPAAYFFAKKRIPTLYSEHLFANSWAEVERFDRGMQKQVKRSLAKFHRAEKKMRSIQIGALLISLVGVWISIRLMQQKKRQI